MEARRYVERDGELVFPPPYAARGVNLTTFLLHAERDVLQQRVCERYLNAAAGAPGRFQAVGSFVMLVWAQMEALSAVDPPYDQMGSTRESEAAFWVLVRDTARGDSLGWFHPYMWVNDGNALILGREVYGFPKALGRLTFPADPFHPTGFQAQTEVRLEGTDDGLARRTVVQVRRRGGGSEHEGLPQEGFTAHLMGELARLFLNLEPGLVEIGSRILLQGAPMLFLRQLRDAAHPQLAAFQEILETHSSLTGFRRGAVLADEYWVQIDSYPSHPIAEDLGLASGALTPMLGFVTEFDFVIGRGIPVLESADGAGLSEVDGGDELDGGTARAAAAVAAAGYAAAAAGNGAGRPGTSLAAGARAVRSGGGVRAPRQDTPRNGAAPARPRKIAILGGGVGALSAALELTEQPGWQERYEITVYQMGWRLGGKGASGRGAFDRIEEHGLHIWFGFYHSAFDMITRVYDELRRSGGAIRNREQAFTPQLDLGVMEYVGREWKPWRFRFPKAPESTPDTIAEYVERMLHWLGLQMNLSDAVADVEAILAEGWHELAEHELEQGVPGALERFLVLPTVAAERAARTVRRIVHGHTDPATGWESVLQVLEAETARLDRHRGRDDTLRRAWILWHLVAASVRGLLQGCGDLLTPLRLHALDSWDLREWLKEHGAPEDACNSALVKGVYDLVFAYEGGDCGTPRLSAGVALQGVLRMAFDYRGAIAFRMEAGMGDVVFAPLYELLSKRGVRFRFFQKVEKLLPARGGRSIGAIRIQQQATLPPGREYQPLRQVRDVPSWPAQPDFRQLSGGGTFKAHDFESDKSALRPNRTELRAGEDFDDVVLGIALGALPDITEDLARANEAWDAMLRHVQTVPTMAMQLWLRRSTEELGWQGGPSVVDGFVNPFNTWGDMSHLVRREDFPHWCTPRSIAYFCGPYPGVPEAKLDDPRDAAQLMAYAGKWLDRNIRYLWPRAVLPGRRFDYELLADPALRKGRERLKSQYFRVNIDGTEQYTASIPGTAQYRLDPADCGFTNLYPAGDWTRSSLNGGCVEAAVESGQAAARALLLRNGWPVAAGAGTDRTSLTRLAAGTALSVAGSLFFGGSSLALQVARRALEKLGGPEPLVARPPRLVTRAARRALGTLADPASLALRPPRLVQRVAERALGILAAPAPLPVHPPGLVQRVVQRLADPAPATLRLPGVVQTVAARTLDRLAEIETTP